MSSTPNGVTFGTLHSWTDLKLILQKAEIGPALPRLNIVTLRGVSGSIDLTDALGTGVQYNDRPLKFTFAVKPGEDFPATRRTVANAISGQRLKITLDDDPAYYYAGRVQVESYASDNLLKTITVSAQCDPWAFFNGSYTRECNSTTQTFLYLNTGTLKSRIPLRNASIDLPYDSELRSPSGDSAAATAGRHFLSDLWPSFVFPAGEQTYIRVRFTEDGALPTPVTVTWQGGVL